MRLNFSYSTDQQIDEGMKRLGKVVEENLEKRKLVV
jgi:DNA-binding transcriptional MocR family regulator